MYHRKSLNQIPCSHKDENYEQLNKVGQGKYGLVYKARHKLDQRIVALKKIIEESPSPSQGFSILALREMNILKRLDNHPNLVKLLDIVVEKDANLTTSTYFVFEYCEHDLEGMMMSNIRFNLSQIKRIIYSILLGLSSLHKKNIIHRDIKTDNILYNKNKEIKVADFGLSKDLNIKRAPLSRKLQHMFYRAPESLFANNDEQLRQAKNYFNLLGNPENENIWSTQSKNDLKMKEYDIIMSQITPEEKANFKNRFVEHLKGMNPNVDDSSLNLLSKMLALDPAQRLSADECLQHPFFSEEPAMADNSEMPQIDDGQEYHQMTQSKIFINERQRQLLEQQTDNNNVNNIAPLPANGAPALTVGGANPVSGNQHLQQRRNRPQNMQQNIQQQQQRNVQNKMINNGQGNHMYPLHNGQVPPQGVSPLPNQPYPINAQNMNRQTHNNQMVQGKNPNNQQRFPQQQNQQLKLHQSQQKVQFPLQNGFRKQQGSSSMIQNSQQQMMQNKPFVPNNNDNNDQGININMNINNSNMNINNSNNFNNIKMQKRAIPGQINTNNSNSSHPNNTNNNNTINQQTNQNIKPTNPNNQYLNVPYKPNSNNNNNQNQNKLNQTTSFQKDQLNNIPNNSIINYSFQNGCLDNKNNNSNNNQPNSKLFFINPQKNTQTNNVSSGMTGSVTSQQQQPQIQNYANSNFYRGGNTQIINQENPQSTTTTNSNTTNTILSGEKNENSLTIDSTFQEDFQQNCNNCSESTEVSNQDNMNNYKPQLQSQYSSRNTVHIQDELSSNFLSKYQQYQNISNTFSNLPITTEQQGVRKYGEKNYQDSNSLNHKRKLSLQENQGNMQNKAELLGETRKKQKQNMTVNTNFSRQISDYPANNVSIQQSQNAIKSQNPIHMQQEQTTNYNQIAVNNTSDIASNTPIQQASIQQAISPILTASRPYAASLDLLQGSSYIKGMESQQQLLQLNQIKNSTANGSIQQANDSKMNQEEGGNTSTCLQILSKIASDQNQVRRGNSFTSQNNSNYKQSSIINSTQSTQNNQCHIGQSNILTATSSLQKASSIAESDGNQLISKLSHFHAINNSDKNTNQTNISQQEISEELPSTPDFNDEKDESSSNAQGRYMKNDSRAIDIVPAQRGQKLSKKMQKYQNKNFNKHNQHQQIASNQSTEGDIPSELQSGIALSQTSQINQSQQFVSKNIRHSANQMHISKQKSAMNQVSANTAIHESTNGNGIEEELQSTPVQQKCSSSSSSSTAANHNQNIYGEDNCQGIDLKASQLTENGAVDPFFREQQQQQQQQQLQQHYNEQFQNSQEQCSQNYQEFQQNSQEYGSILRDQMGRKLSDNFVYADLMGSPNCVDLNSQFSMGRQTSASIMNNCNSNNLLRLSQASIPHSLFGGMIQSPFHSDYLIIRDPNILIDSPSYNISPNHNDIHRYHQFSDMYANQMDSTSPFLIGGINNYSMPPLILGNQTPGDGAQN